jgi:hypothetical protein
MIDRATGDARRIGYEAVHRPSAKDRVSEKDEQLMSPDFRTELSRRTQPATGTIVPVILSGGSGTRLWPVSRESFPKQFWPLASE